MAKPDWGRKRRLRPRANQTDCHAQDNSGCDVPQRKAKSRVIVVPLRKAKRTAILSAVTQFHGNVCLAAEKLEIGRTTLYRKLKEYGVPLGRRRSRKETRRSRGLAR